MPRRAIALATCAAALSAVGVACAPAAQAAGRCGPLAQRPWCDTTLSPDARAGLLLNALTQDEKVSLLGGDDFNGGTGHTGYSQGVPRVGLPDEYFSDGPLGPRQGKTTAMPAPTGLAATFDPALAYAAGAEVATEVRDKGNDVVFAPTVNIMRNPLGGRTFESYGEDPFLDSRLTVPWIEGAQARGVMATVKHYVANSQEGQDATGQAGQPGAPLGVGVNGTRYLIDEHIDDRTLHEIYMPHFEAAVKQAHSALVMCAYNQVNDFFSCENQHLLQDILRRSWDFNGEIVADYGAAHPNGTAAGLNAGDDFEAWPPWAYQPAEVDAALATGQVSQATLDLRVREILRTLFAYGFFDRPAYRNDDSDQQRITPAFPFGFGLSYTSFRFSGLRVHRASRGLKAPDGSPARFVVSATVRNTGHRPGVAVPELYLGLPSSTAVPEPPIQLKGFTRVNVRPGKSRRFSIPLDARDFSYWNTGAQKWQLVPGCYDVLLGSSSRALPVSMKIGWTGHRCGKK